MVVRTKFIQSGRTNAENNFSQITHLIWNYNNVYIQGTTEGSVT